MGRGQTKDEEAAYSGTVARAKSHGEPWWSLQRLPCYKKTNAGKKNPPTSIAQPRTGT